MLWMGRFGEFQEGKAFLQEKYNCGFVLNIDWFQAYKYKTCSIGVIYLVILNLPRQVKFKRESVILVGLIPGPCEPPKTVNTYLTPLVYELLSLWDGIRCKMPSMKENVMVRCALLCEACDLPAGRKVCGFLSYMANLGCSRCYIKFTGGFGSRNFSGLVDSQRTNECHRRDVQEI